MIYKDFQGMKLSALGFGAMRLPLIDGNDRQIDEEATFRMVDTAIENGINYFDTGWSYHGGNCESVMGKALARYPRESYYIAAKCPGYDSSNWPRAEEIFDTADKKEILSDLFRNPKEEGSELTAMLDYRYPYEEATKTPVKKTASQLNESGALSGKRTAILAIENTFEAGEQGKTIFESCGISASDIVSFVTDKK